MCRLSKEHKEERISKVLKALKLLKVPSSTDTIRFTINSNEKYSYYKMNNKEVARCLNILKKREKIICEEGLCKVK